MRPDDCNVMGSVHGGVILKMIEEAGNIIGTRHCNMQIGVRDNHINAKLFIVLSVKVNEILFDIRS